MKTPLITILFVLVFAGLTYGQQGSTPDCSAQLQTANQRLEKTLDAYDKAMAVVASKDQLIAAHVALEDLMREWLKVKDEMIADLKADNDFLRKKASGAKSKFRQLIEKIEKILIFAGGVYIGKGI